MKLLGVKLNLNLPFRGFDSNHVQNQMRQKSKYLQMQKWVK
jgi:hypothetical protein